MPRNFGILFVLVVFYLANYSNASKCVLTSWGPWSKCLGNCDYAQKVRNRDVLRPAFPERNLVTGEIFIRACPPLYEVETCSPTNCDEDSPFAKGLVGPIPMLLGADVEPKQNSNNTELIENLDAEIVEDAKKDKKPLNSKPEKRVAVAGTTLVSWVKSLNRSNCGLPNKRCCRVKRSVTICPDGSRPKQLVRWHRQKDETFCRAFYYPYCGSKYETLDSVPLVSENECTETCFNQAEKAILPSLRII